MDIKFRQLNPHACRTYLIGQKNSNEVAIIDPVLDHVNDYVEQFNHENQELRYIIDTHTHADHISGSAVLKDIIGCEYLMHENAPSKCVTKYLSGGTELDILGLNIQVIYTPGHTQDSISLAFNGRLLTGDALFLDDGGAGRDDLPGGDPKMHWETIKKFLKLPEQYVVYPAHEYRNRKPSSLKQQKTTNPHLKPRTMEEFVTYIEDLRLGPADWMKDVLSANYACARDPKAAWIPVDVPACEIKGTLDHGVNDIQVEPITVLDLKVMLDSSEPLLLLDVREEKELTAELGHLEGIAHVPISSLTSQLNELEKFKDRKIITVCRSGARAYTAAQILTQAGFPNVQVLDGGMILWNQAGYQVSRAWEI
jgi:glyoxylase-like metal-dependent hydrolase (beta-lactamase superfamily II)/rhodanese-related sulfurtransferase